MGFEEEFKNSFEEYKEIDAASENLLLTNLDT